MIKCKILSLALFINDRKNEHIESKYFKNTSFIFTEIVFISIETTIIKKIQ